MNKLQEEAFIKAADLISILWEDLNDKEPELSKEELMIKDLIWGVNQQIWTIRRIINNSYGE